MSLSIRVLLNFVGLQFLVEINFFLNLTSKKGKLPQIHAENFSIFFPKYI